MFSRSLHELYPDPANMFATVAVAPLHCLSMKRIILKGMFHLRLFAVKVASDVNPVLSAFTLTSILHRTFLTIIFLPILVDSVVPMAMSSIVPVLTTVPPERNSISPASTPMLKSENFFSMSDLLRLCPENLP